jgi:hypothetical protein
MDLLLKSFNLSKIVAIADNALSGLNHASKFVWSTGKAVCTHAQPISIKDLIGVKGCTLSGSKVGVDEILGRHFVSLVLFAVVYKHSCNNFILPSVK